MCWREYYLTRHIFKWQVDKWIAHDFVVNYSSDWEICAKFNFIQNYYYPTYNLSVCKRPTINRNVNKWTKCVWSSHTGVHIHTIHTCRLWNVNVNAIETNHILIKPLSLMVILIYMMWMRVWRKAYGNMVNEMWNKRLPFCHFLSVALDVRVRVRF